MTRFPAALLIILAATACKAPVEAPEDLGEASLYLFANFDSESGESLAALVRNTLIHEIGHHFGYSDEDMEQIEFGTP